MVEFSASVLPQSLQDAVEVVRKLKIRYLWIDALCILQDGKRDWHRESGMMASVYQNAFIAIAATASAARDQGFLYPRSLAIQIRAPLVRVHVSAKKREAKKKHNITYVR